MANAGWYDDGSGRQRWWDGAVWSDNFLDEADSAPIEQSEPDPEPVHSSAVAEPDAGAASTATEQARGAADEQTTPSFRNFTGDLVHEARMRRLLADGEQLVAIVHKGDRFMTVTTRRIVLHESNGNFSAIRISQIAAIEVTTHGGEEPYLKLYFGDGLSRTLGASNVEQAVAILSALGQP